MADYQSIHSGATIDNRVTLAQQNYEEIQALKARMSVAESDLEGKADATSVTAVNSRVGGVEAKMSSAASTSNKLIDKAYVDDALSGKVDKSGGKGLSTNDFTNDYKTKLDGLPTGLAISNALDTKASASSVTDVSGRVTEIEEKIPSVASSSNKLTDKTYVDTAISGLNSVINGKASASELAGVSTSVDAIEAKIPSDATSSNQLADKAFVNNGLSGKVNAVAGKGLSTNDYTTSDKGKLDSLPSGSQLQSDLAGKQATLVSGQNIKTVNGVSLLGSGNIVAGEPYAVKYTEQSLTNAQKTQARNNIGAASLEDLQTEEYITVTTLPSPGSATMGKIYLVGPDENDNYERYITQRSGGGAYSWVSIGSTAIDMSSKADADVVCYLGEVIEIL